VGNVVEITKDVFIKNLNRLDDCSGNVPLGASEGGYDETSDGLAVLSLPEVEDWEHARYFLHERFWVPLRDFYVIRPIRTGLGSNICTKSKWYYFKGVTHSSLNAAQKFPDVLACQLFGELGKVDGVSITKGLDFDLSRPFGDLAKIFEDLRDAFKIINA